MRWAGNVSTILIAFARTTKSTMKPTGSGIDAFTSSPRLNHRNSPFELAGPTYAKLVTRFVRLRQSSKARPVASMAKSGNQNFRMFESAEPGRDNGVVSPIQTLCRYRVRARTPAYGRNPLRPPAGCAG